MRDMESTPRCDEIRAVLPLVVGGELEPSDLAAGERHLAACGACRAELERYRAARAALLRAAELLPPAPAQWTLLRARLVAEGRIHGAQGARAPARRSWRAGAAAALLLCAAGAFLLRGPALEPGSELPLSTSELSSSAEPAASGTLVQPVALRPLPREEWPAPTPAPSTTTEPFGGSTPVAVPAGAYTRRIR